MGDHQKILQPLQDFRVQVTLALQLRLLPFSHPPSTNDRPQLVERSIVPGTSLRSPKAPDSHPRRLCLRPGRLLRWGLQHHDQKLMSDRWLVAAPLCRSFIVPFKAPSPTAKSRKASMAAMCAGEKTTTKTKNQWQLEYWTLFLPRGQSFLQTTHQNRRRLHIIIWVYYASYLMI